MLTPEKLTRLPLYQGISFMVISPNYVVTFITVLNNNLLHNKQVFEMR